MVPCRREYVCFVGKMSGWVGWCGNCRFGNIDYYLWSFCEVFRGLNKKKSILDERRKGGGCDMSDF